MNFRNCSSDVISGGALKLCIGAAEAFPTAISSPNNRAIPDLYILEPQQRLSLVELTKY
ncbi:MULTISPECIES: hypothetical protein [unclassified Sulfitobacter]|nr:MULTISPECIES: hypothetical protein [unclassified Sulfitobacter]